METKHFGKYLNIFASIFVLYMVYIGFSPSEKTKRIENLNNQIPNICIYNENVKIKDRLNIHCPNSEITVAETSWEIVDDEKKIIDYYEKEMKRNGWEDFYLRKGNSSVDNSPTKEYVFKKKNGPTFSVKFRHDKNFYQYQIYFSDHQVLVNKLKEFFR